MKPPLKVDVLDSVFDPESDDRIIQKKQVDAKDLYRVFLYLKGLDLPLVRSVTYYLHPTFRPQTHRISRVPQNPMAKLVIWTWGTFVVRADIEDLEGVVTQTTHQLTWDSEVDPRRVHLA
jgi:hypothetical protein